MTNGKEKILNICVTRIKYKSVGHILSDLKCCDEKNNLKTTVIYSPNKKY